MSAFWRGLDERTGWISAARRWLSEPVPSRGGWLFALGSSALFLLLLQLVTGFALATSYAATPDHARQSVYFIEKSSPAGSLLRGLHHWGATLLVVLAVLHMARVFFHGAYKMPRRENWWLGLLLLLGTLAFAFTGRLLPWDQKGYWATVVAVRIVATVPLAGPALARLLSGGASIGAPALSRFAAIHFVLLPAAMALLAAAHVALVRRQGHSRLPGDRAPLDPFAPRQLAREAAAAAGLFALLLVLAHAFPAPLQAAADPSDAAYAPRPDWYFLFLFQLLRVFRGRWEIVGTVVLPAAGLAFLVAVPLLDRGPERAASRRWPWIAVGGALLGAAVALTLAAAPGSRATGARIAMSEPPPPPSAFLSGSLANYDVSAFSPGVLRGGRLIATHKCLECHLIAGDGNEKGIHLKHVADRRTRDWLIAHFKAPRDFSPASRMPAYVSLSERDLSDMADYLLALP